MSKKNEGKLDILCLAFRTDKLSNNVSNKPSYDAQQHRKADLMQLSN
jgi:hypothetical protein